MNFSKLNSSLIDKNFDNTDFKIGKFIPGKNRIPVVSSNKFGVKYDYVLLLALIKDEVLKKKNFTRKMGSKWIIPMPNIKILN